MLLKKKFKLDNKNSNNNTLFTFFSICENKVIASFCLFYEIELKHNTISYKRYN